MSAREEPPSVEPKPFSSGQIGKLLMGFLKHFPRLLKRPLSTCATPTLRKQQSFENVVPGCIAVYVYFEVSRSDRVRARASDLPARPP